MDDDKKQILMKEAGKHMMLAQSLIIACEELDTDVQHYPVLMVIRGDQSGRCTVCTQLKPVETARAMGVYLTNLVGQLSESPPMQIRRLSEEEIAALPRDPQPPLSKPDPIDVTPKGDSDANS